MIDLVAQSGLCFRFSPPVQQESTALLVDTSDLTFWKDKYLVAPMLLRKFQTVMFCMHSGPLVQSGRSL